MQGEEAQEKRREGRGCRRDREIGDESMGAEVGRVMGQGQESVRGRERRMRSRGRGWKG